MELNNRQRQAVEHQNGPLLIIAGAGSGKTRTLVSRLQTLIARGVPPERIVAITFTNKAANEMLERVAHGRKGGSMPFIGTFHRFGARVLREQAEKLGRTQAFSIFDEDDAASLIRKITKDLGIAAARVSPASTGSIISRMKDSLADPTEYLYGERALIFTAYEEALRKSNAFDFADLIEKVVRVWNRYPAILADYQGRYDHVLVDEYQDINASQGALVSLLAAKHRNLAVVGDDAQSIYGWRGADIGTFLAFEKTWPDARVITLDQSYRSTPPIITAASALISHNAHQKPKELWTDNKGDTLIRVVEASDGDEEALWVTERISELPRDRQIAILYRTNAQSRAIEQALIATNLPYQMFGGVRFYERKEIKDILAALRIVANPVDSAAHERLEKSLGKRESARVFVALAGEVGTTGPVELIHRFLTASRYAEFLSEKFANADERMQNIAELISFAAPFATTIDFLERATLAQSTDSPAVASGTHAKRLPINLMTIHMAKGLEFDEVFVCGVAEGLLPHQMSYKTERELEEERRLMYVAMTRARERLTLSFSRLPSRFLYELPPELTEFVSLTGRSDGLPEDDIVYLD